MLRACATGACLLARSDRFGLSTVVMAASLIRLAFLFRAPPLYVGGDSQTYLQPAIELLQGVGFDPDIKRPPGYPLFLAGVLATFAAARNPSAGRLLLVGLLFGLAGAAHERTLMLLGLLPLAMLLTGCSWRGTLRGGGVGLIGFMVVLI